MASRIRPPCVIGVVLVKDKFTPFWCFSFLVEKPCWESGQNMDSVAGHDKKMEKLEQKIRA